MSNWECYFNKGFNSFIKVGLSKEEIAGVKWLANRIAFSKKDEKAYQEDGIGIAKRYFTGLVGEYAAVKVLNAWGLSKRYNFNQSVGASYDFNIPDLVEYGFGVGCKTCGYGRNVKVKENEVYPEIISVYVDDNKVKTENIEAVVYICGIATPEVLNAYSSPDLITEDIIHNKDGKVTAKVGFDRLDKLMVFTPENIMKYKSKLNVNWYVDMTDKKRSEMFIFTTYVDYKDIDGKMHLVFYNSTNTIIDNSIIEVVDPYSEEGIKRLEQILDTNRLYVGYRIKTVFEWIQTYWKDKELTIHCMDFWEMIYGDEGLKNVWTMKSRSEGLSNLNVIKSEVIGIISKDMKKVKCDFAYMDLYLFIWVIRRYKWMGYVA